MLPESLPYYLAHHLSDCLLRHFLNRLMTRRPHEGSSSATWSCCMVHLVLSACCGTAQHKLAYVHQSKVYCACVCHNNLHLREVTPVDKTPCMEDNWGFTVVQSLLIQRIQCLFLLDPFLENTLSYTGIGKRIRGSGLWLGTARYMSPLRKFRILLLLSDGNCHLPS
jgi:hypothetical protein